MSKTKSRPKAAGQAQQLHQYGALRSYLLASPAEGVCGDVESIDQFNQVFVPWLELAAEPSHYGEL